MSIQAFKEGFFDQWPSFPILRAPIYVIDIEYNVESYKKTLIKNCSEEQLFHPPHVLHIELTHAALRPHLSSPYKRLDMALTNLLESISTPDAETIPRKARPDACREMQEALEEATIIQPHFLMRRLRIFGAVLRIWLVAVLLTIVWPLYTITVTVWTLCADGPEDAKNEFIKAVGLLCRLILNILLYTGALIIAPFFPQVLSYLPDIDAVQDNYITRTVPRESSPTGAAAAAADFASCASPELGCAITPRRGASLTPPTGTAACEADFAPHAAPKLGCAITPRRGTSLTPPLVTPRSSGATTPGQASAVVTYMPDPVTGTRTDPMSTR